MPRIEEIILPEEIAGDYEAESPFNSLNGIKRLNTFVGPNNSGKSRLLRGLFLAGSNLLVSSDDEDASKVRSSVREGLRLASELTYPTELEVQVQDILLSQAYGFHRLSQNLGSKNQQEKEIGELAMKIQNHVSAQLRRQKAQSPFDLNTYSAAASIMHSINKGLAALKEKSQPKQPGGTLKPAPKPPFHAAKFIYIPTLRGMRLAIDGSDLKYAYFDRTWSDYLKGQKKQSRSDDENIERARREMSGNTIVTGLDFYDVLTDRLLGSLADREFIREYQDYLSQTFFQGAPVALIPRRGHDTVNIKVGK